jgi:hypothetical protein
MKRYDIDQINYIFECNCDGDNTYVPYETAAKLARACKLYEEARAAHAMDDCDNLAAKLELDAAQLYKESMEN